MLDPKHLTRVVRAHEDHGWDHELFTATVTEHIQLRLAHRFSTSHPTAAATVCASLDALYRGRLTVHVITGGSTADQAREGDCVAEDERRDRTAEWMLVVLRALSETALFSYKGHHHRFGGSSPAADRVGAAQAGVSRCSGSAGEHEAADQVIPLVRAEAGRSVPTGA